jgi:hypothetical protein
LTGFSRSLLKTNLVLEQALIYFILYIIDIINYPVQNFKFV